MGGVLNRVRGLFGRPDASEEDRREEAERVHEDNLAHQELEGRLADTRVDERYPGLEHFDDNPR